MTPSEFKLIFPAFAAENDVRIQFELDGADPIFDIERWGALYPRGLANYVAHNLAMSSLAGVTVGGVVGVSDTSLMKKVGDVQTTKSELMLDKQSKNPFFKTVFGQEYLRLALRVGMGAVTV